MPCTFKTALIVSMKCNSPVCSSKEFCQGIYYSSYQRRRKRVGKMGIFAQPDFARIENRAEKD